jgi:hypothetical protein
MAAAGFLFILGLGRTSRALRSLLARLYWPLFSSLIFGAVRWAARKGCAASGKRDDASEEQESRESKIAQNKPTTRARGKLKNLWESGF